MFSPVFSNVTTATLQNPLQIRTWLEELMQAYPVEISTPLASYIYARGVRPEYAGINKRIIKQATLMDWFIGRMTLDIYQLARTPEAEYEHFLDLLDLKSSQALLQLGQIAVNYDLYPCDYNESNLSRINCADARLAFERSFLEEAVLNSAFAILAGIFYYVHGKLYPVKT
ncbi:MAG: hypothetical protein GX119_04315 [Syntrophomonadaceae bacterium]|jgi:hypothetical protein|nr:hypothetical protein [Syntrophomonadaceae bacterium]